MKPKQFVEAVSTLDLMNTFNPYSHQCIVHDVDNAPHRRATTLHMLLAKAEDSEIDSFWIGRDLGYRGGRRTGLALTDDVHFLIHARRWGIRAERSTKGEAVRERTAAVIWGALSQIEASIFLWNVFPLHPHNVDDPFSNRPHNSHERKIGEEILSELIGMLKPRRLIAIGNDAAQTAHRLASYHDVYQVRHPSYGGQNVFLQQIQKLYRLPQIGAQATFW